MLTDAVTVRNVPTLTNTCQVSDAYLNMLIGAADRAIKRHCKQDLELDSYVEFYDGNNQRELVLRQAPVWWGQTTLAGATLTLPQSTINVASTKNFPPGVGGNPNADQPTLSVQTGTTTWTTVNYTGTTSTSFTGCTGGTGTLTAGNGVFPVAVFYDSGGFAGVPANSFAAGSIYVPGTQYMPELDRKGRQSRRGTLLKIGTAGPSMFGFFPFLGNYGGKLASYGLPTWPRGDKNLKVCFSAGYYPIPDDLRYAATMLVAWMIRSLPQGAPLSNESLGSYSYSILSQNVEIPEVGSLNRVLAPYREVSWSGGP